MDLDALEAAARELLTPNAWGYYSAGADDEITLRDNVEAWRRLRIRPRVLRDVSVVDTSTTVLGTPVALPVLVAPMAYHRLAHDEGEAATARGAAAAGTILVTSTLATVSLEDTATAAPGAPRWLQVYLRRDRGWAAELVARAAAAGYEALVFTVDLPVLGHRRVDEANAFALPAGMAMANLPVLAATVAGGSALTAHVRDDLDPSLTFDDITWLRDLSGLPVLVKGVLRGDDARACVDAGAAGIVVSNHGGRQLDTAVATADALAEVVAAVGGDVEVLVDGGIRRGTDVLKALALGARAVLVGRPVLWGLATGGADGVHAVLDGLGAEFARALALSGCPGAADVTPDLLAR
jgi:4-hydroxymandelate oxidase